MRLLVLAAGYATRLSPLTDNCAKPLLPVNGKSMLDHILGRFQGCSFDEVHVVTNDKFYHDFERWAKTVSYPWKINTLNDGSTHSQNQRGAIGDIAFAIESAKIDDDLVVIAGDNLLSDALSDFVNSTNGIIVGTYDIGKLELVKELSQIVHDNDLRITSFTEKPANPTRTTVGIALYKFPRRVLSMIRYYVAAGHNPDQPGRLIEWFVNSQVPCYAWLISGKWADIGTFDAYMNAETILQ